MERAVARVGPFESVEVTEELTRPVLTDSMGLLCTVDLLSATCCAKRQDFQLRCVIDFWITRLSDPFCCGQGAAPLISDFGLRHRTL